MTGPPFDDRALAALRALIRAELAELTYLGTWEYQVTSATETTFDGLPTSTAFPLPGLVGVPHRPGVAGARCAPAPGSLVLVGFANGDPGRPFVRAYDVTPSDSTAIDTTGTLALGQSASAVELAGGGPAVARVGDSAGRLCLANGAPTLFYSPSPTAPYVAVPAAAVPGAPTPADAGVTVAIATGSPVVTSG